MTRGADGIWQQEPSHGAACGVICENCASIIIGQCGVQRGAARLCIRQAPTPAAGIISKVPTNRAATSLISRFKIYAAMFLILKSSIFGGHEWSTALYYGHNHSSRKFAERCCCRTTLRLRRTQYVLALAIIPVAGGRLICAPRLKLENTNIEICQARRRRRRRPQRRRRRWGVSMPQRLLQ